MKVYSSEIGASYRIEVRSGSTFHAFSNLDHNNSAYENVAECIKNKLINYVPVHAEKLVLIF